MSENYLESRNYMEFPKLITKALYHMQLQFCPFDLVPRFPTWRHLRGPAEGLRLLEVPQPRRRPALPLRLRVAVRHEGQRRHHPGHQAAVGGAQGTSADVPLDGLRAHLVRG